jgi:hypothetical protein
MEKCKRLRGWKLEEALGSSKKKKPLEKGRGSNLATALLSLWAHGKLSAIQTRKHMLQFWMGATMWSWQICLKQETMEKCQGMLTVT